ncbi:MAG: TonB family protein [Flavobacteriales bacterium]
MMIARSSFTLLSMAVALNLVAQVQTTEIDLSAEPVHAFVDQPPEYPDGDLGLRLYLAQHLNLPDSLAGTNIAGTVKVRFVVDRTGKVRDARVIFSLQPYVDNEALRLISSMPPWKPGRQRGKPVNVMVVLPIRIG